MLNPHEFHDVTCNDEHMTSMPTYAMHCVSNWSYLMQPLPRTLYRGSFSSVVPPKSPL